MKSTMHILPKRYLRNNLPTACTRQYKTLISEVLLSIQFVVVLFSQPFGNATIVHRKQQDQQQFINNETNSNSSSISWLPEDDDMLLDTASAAAADNKDDDNTEYGAWSSKTGISLEQCYTRFLEQDTDNDGALDRMEYLFLLQDLATNELPKECSGSKGNTTTDNSTAGNNLPVNVVRIVNTIFKSYAAVACRTCAKYPEIATASIETSAKNQHPRYECCGTPLVLPYTNYPEEYIYLLCLYVVVTFADECEKQQQDEVRNSPNRTLAPSPAISNTISPSPSMSFENKIATMKPSIMVNHSNKHPTTTEISPIGMPTNIFNTSNSTANITHSDNGDSLETEVGTSNSTTNDIDVDRSESPSTYNNNTTENDNEKIDTAASEGSKSFLIVLLLIGCLLFVCSLGSVITAMNRRRKKKMLANGSYNTTSERYYNPYTIEAYHGNNTDAVLTKNDANTKHSKNDGLFFFQTRGLYSTTTNSQGSYDVYDPDYGRSSGFSDDMIRIQPTTYDEDETHILVDVHKDDHYNQTNGLLSSSSSNLRLYDEICAEYTNHNDDELQRRVATNKSDDNASSSSRGSSLLLFDEDLPTSTTMTTATTERLALSSLTSLSPPTGSNLDFDIDDNVVVKETAWKEFQMQCSPTADDDSGIGLTLEDFDQMLLSNTPSSPVQSPRTTSTRKKKNLGVSMSELDGLTLSSPNANKNRSLTNVLASILPPSLGQQSPKKSSTKVKKKTKAKSDAIRLSKTTAKVSSSTSDKIMATKTSKSNYDVKNDNIFTSKGEYDIV